MLWRLLLCCLLCSGVGAEPEVGKARLVLCAALDMVGRKALEFGAYDQALPLLRFHEKVVAGDPNRQNDRLRLRRFQSLARLGQGHNLAALESTTAFLEESPVHQGLLRAMALWRLARFEELKDQLERLEQLPVKNGIERFVLAGLRFRLKAAEGRLEAGEVLARGREALDILARYRSDRKPTTGEPLYLRLGLELWQEPILDLIHEESGDPKLQAQLIELLFDGPELLERLARQNLTPTHLNPEFGLAVLEQLLVPYEDFLAHQWLDRAEKNRQEIQATLDELQPTVEKAANGFLQDCGKLGTMLLPFCQGLEFEGEAFSPEILEFNLAEGSLRQLRERFLAAQLRGILGLQEGRLDRVLEARAEHLLNSLSELQKATSYRGREDARYPQIEFWQRQRPRETLVEQRALLDQLRSQSARLGDEEARFELAWLEGRHEALQGRWKQCQQVVEAVLLESSQQLAASAREQLLQRQRWRKLYRLWSESLLEQDRPQEALEALERGRRADDQQRRLATQLDASVGQSLAARRALLQEQVLGPTSGAPQVKESLQGLDLESTRLQVPPVAQWERVCQALPEDFAVLCYFSLEDRLCLFALDRQGLTRASVALSRAGLDQRVREFRRHLVQIPIERPEVVAPGWLDRAYGQEYRRLAGELHNHLIAPLAPRLEGKRVLGILATGTLQYLPFSALLPEGGDASDFLCRRWACVQLTGLESLLDLMAYPPGEIQSWCGLGDPDGSLPFASREVQAIAGQFSRPQVYLGARARSEVLQFVPPAPEALHLATHGYLDSANPRSSYLLMAGSRLRISDIYRLPLAETRLVVLSACQSGLGEVEPGSEITSLSDAFRVAGSRAVLASLWKVADESTAQLMQSFYRHCPRLGSAGALRQAEVELLDRPETSHPFFWAPFVLSGDFR